MLLTTIAITIATESNIVGYRAEGLISWIGWHDRDKFGQR